MQSQFNSYIDNIDTDFWQNLCKSRGQLRHYDKGEAFVTAGEVGRYIGYVESALSFCGTVSLSVAEAGRSKF